MNAPVANPKLSENDVISSDSTPILQRSGAVDAVLVKKSFMGFFSYYKISNTTGKWVVDENNKVSLPSTYYIVGKYDDGMVLPVSSGGRRRRNRRKSRKGKKSSSRRTRRYRR